MAPKAATKKASATSSHSSYQDMIKDAILKLKERNGSSRQAIKKYVKANNNLGDTTDAAFTSHISKALKSGVEKGVFAQPKGASGPVKLNKPGSTSTEKKPAAAKTSAAKPKTAVAKKTTTAKKAAPKKPAAAKKTPTSPKQPAAKKATTTKKAAPKKSATPKAAPAVGEEKPKVLGKTKTGRVVKTTKPQTEKKAPAKKAAPKKAAPKKSTPKKA